MALAGPGSVSAVDAARASRPAVAARRPQAAAAASVTATATDAAEIAASAVARTAPERQAGTRPAAVIPAPSLAEAPSDAAQSGAWDGLALRVAGLQVPAGAALRTPQPVEVAPLPPLLPAVVSRWAVQLVAGPGLTYRHLGTASGLSYTTNSLATPVTAAPVFSNGNINRVQTTSTSSAASLERPALGYAAQLSIRRTLTPHWTVSAGLGYAEYATALALRQVSAAQITRASYDFAFLDSLSRASGTTIRQRDTYRFLTVPLRAGYVWTTGPRWQVGLLGGFDAAIYLGGTSTEGSACACQPQTWGASGSPYRSLSLAASLGAEVRYRLAGPWQLLVQPTASYMLSPLAKPTSGYSIRHLLGGTALLGMSYDLP
ncbi:outer membrane beta-barrel protein [Hymenobacter convexus]|uniref:outer membrane beta-barrel protein n=1 Tax=Hymenobacter sp. CA1UV-4 TaxID=3063782 RepID=UPI0027127B48|nr:outer membrane beta-barrel protein [Hymenobacter sp. CA1UV-4]MDO7853773.1 outer membrane beta-barrel protein [Hymenobacter sp. CA1UV-4]